ncbi:ComEA family DNA-binding protein [Pseudomonas atacamensis]|uniref:ComEA family DNA-binding protein n=1 Tax=Pseudomonas atacamensis TaxID=2565368 RepID=UPI00244B7CB7|nr:helix-hairpin-helix domain-containing protein [Pseudomonas atacamensis]MDH2078396.1 helix-hairpin-helix domain-containing protein [Pseudomonas atacamensis]
MRKGYFYSLVFALLTGAAVAAPVAPVAPVATDSARPPMGVSQSPSAKVDLNNADAITLQKSLAGVGEAKAKAIVAYREINGPFASIDELLEVKGIGKAILDRNRDNLEIN